MASELAGAEVRPDTLILLEPRYKTHSFGQPPSKSPLLAGTGMNHTVVRHVPSNVFNTFELYKHLLFPSWFAEGISFNLVTCFQDDFPS